MWREGRNPNFSGVQSYLKFHHDIMKLACDFSYQADNTDLGINN